MTADNELQGPFTGSFGGLNLANAAGDIPPTDSTVFHNCEISDDGAVVRRKGTTLFANSNIGTDAAMYSTALRTKAGNEYIVNVISTGVSVLKMRSSPTTKVVTATNAMAKTFWKVPFTNCNFTTVTAPYDRLLIFTGTHPVVQLSFLERTAEFTCQSAGGGVGRFTAPYTANDSTLWNDTTVANYWVRDEVNNVNYTLVTKAVGFDITINGTFTVGQKLTLQLIQVTWQWWAEAEYFEGKNFAQQLSRSNATDLDQNVKIPTDLITDYPLIKRNASYFGLYATSTPKGSGASTYSMVAIPTTENEFNFTGGGRYIGSANNPPLYAPFFLTFGAKQAAGGVGTAYVFRRRQLRLKRGTPMTPQIIEVYANGVLANWVVANSINDSAPPKQDYQLFYNTVNVAATGSVSSSTAPCNEIDFNFAGTSPAYSDTILIVNRENTWFLGAQALNYRMLTSSGGNLDGTYVPAPGLGFSCDYVAGRFHTNGIVYRDRLFLVTPQGSADQLAVSEVADVTVPGEFYTFFQYDENLSGALTDTFTINVTSSARENITALVGWQSSVLVFSNEAAYAISGGETFGPNDYAVTLASSYGAFNQRCVAVTALTVLYMNRYGVFDLLTKPNTDQYGASERSGKVRPLFNNDLVGDSLNNLHWMSYNTSTSKLYVGLAVGTDTIYTSRVLMYSTTWDAWSTLSSATPWQMTNATQTFNTTIFFAKLYYPFIGYLASEQNHYFDFLNTNNNLTWTNECLPDYAFPTTDAFGGVVKSPVPFSPVLNDAYGTNITKQLDTYIQSGGTASLIEPRNPVGDIPGAANLIGNATPPTRYLPVGALWQGGGHIYYPNATLNGLTGQLRRYTLSPLTGFPGTTPNSIVVGAVYPSIYASPMFDLESMGRLKRLRKLHVKWDTSIVLTPQVHQSIVFTDVKRYNAAFVTVLSNYRDQQQISQDSQLVLDDIALTTPAIRTLLNTFTLQGYGCDYQFYVTSIGGESFKLTGYEFDIKPQRDKRYQRR